MAWAGSNPYAALSSATSAPAHQTQRDQPAPKKNLALAKDASKIHTAPEPKPVKVADPKKGTGNNSAKPGRPEREADRKGRTYPKKSGTGRGKEQPRDGKDWGEGKQGKRVEDGVAEAGKPTDGTVGEPEPHVRREGRDGERRRDGRGRGRGGPREPEIPELTPEEEAALKAAKEAEERQMTLEEWQAKKAAAAPVVELKEARKVERDPSLTTPVKQSVVVDAEFEGKKQQQKKKDASGPKKEVLSLGPAPRKKREEQAASPGAGGKGGGKRSGNNNANNNNNHGGNAGPAINLEDANLFPSLGGGKK